MKKTILISCLISACVIVLTQCSQNVPESKETKISEPAADSTVLNVMSDQSQIERGRHLVAICVCDDCHSPKIMTQEGPVVDSTKRLSGHPADMKLPEIKQSEIAPGKWVLGEQDLTAWVGLWGVSFAVNLTPDTATGIGAWTPELFIKIIRTGKFMGIESGRSLLPPMPWQNYSQMSDEDLTAIFTYLKSLPPISNKVPDPLPPLAMKKG